MTTIKAGRIIRVENKDRIFGSADFYNAVWIEDANGKNERCLLFTDTEILKAEARSAKNSEDLTKKTYLMNLFD